MLQQEETEDRLMSVFGTRDKGFGLRPESLAVLQASGLHLLQQRNEETSPRFQYCAASLVFS